MKLTDRKLLTVVAEEALERRVVEDLREAGVGGYTIVPARGAGARGERPADWEQSRSIKVEVVCDEATAIALAQQLHDRYFADYAIVVWLEDVQVLRPDKFVPERGADG